MKCRDLLHKTSTKSALLNSRLFFRYVEQSIELPACPDLEVSQIYLKKNILQSVKQLFGEEGSKSSVDIIKYNAVERRFILRCKSDSYVRLRAALTVATKYEGEQCIYTVHRATSNLLSFTSDSRTYKH